MIFPFIFGVDINVSFNGPSSPLGHLEIRSVRLLFNARMLLGMLLPMLCLWSDRFCHVRWGNLLRWKLLRQLLFVLLTYHADTVRRCAPRSDFHCIDRASSGNAAPLPDEVRNQKEV
jgi:hypothetical protein